MTVTPIFTLYNICNQYKKAANLNDLFIDTPEINVIDNKLADEEQTGDALDLAEVKTDGLTIDTKKNKSIKKASAGKLVATGALCGLGILGAKITGGLSLLASAPFFSACSSKKTECIKTKTRVASVGTIVVYCGGKVISIGEGSQKIVFRSKKRIDKEIGKLKQIYKLVSELNAYIPSMPVQKVVIIEKGGYYYPKDHKIGIPLASDFLDTVAHEMGHAIFRVRLVKDELWKKIYYLSLGDKNYEILKDFYYGKSLDTNAGHPWDNADELFASSFAIYRLHPDTFIKTLLDPNTKKSRLRFGKLIFLYLRDKIFNGRIFSESPPFPQESVGEIKEEEILTALYKSLTAYERYNIFSTAKNILLQNKKWLIQTLLKNLNDNDSRARRAALVAISRLRLKLGFKDSKFVVPLIRALSDKVVLVRRMAAKVIGTLGIKDERFINPLIKVLQNKLELGFVRANAAEAIGELGIKDIRFVRPLIKAALRDKEENVRINAAKAIGRLRDKRFIKPLIKALRNKAVDVRINAAKAIGRLRLRDKRLIGPLIKALGDDDYGVHFWASRAIIKLGFKNEMFVLPLIKALRNKKAIIRYSAAKLIGKLGLKDKRFIKPLLRAFGDKNRHVRWNAVGAIGRLGIKDERFIPLLIRALGDREYFIRREAAEAVGKLRIKDQRFIIPLIKLLDDEEHEVRERAARALGEIGDKHILHILRKKAFSDSDSYVKIALQEAIVKIRKREAERTKP